MKKIVSQLSAAMLVGALVFTTSCKKPEATVTASKSADVAIGEPVKFSSSEELLKNTQISYDFGDGQRSEGIISPSHAYGAAGTYTVSVEFLRTKNAEKSKGKRTWGTADVTVVAVTPTFEVKDASGTAATSARVNQAIMLTNTTVQSTAIQSPITYSWVANGTVVSTTKNFTWTPNSAGKVVIKLMATQGNTSVYSAEQTIQVSGQDLSVSELQALIGGKWNVSSSESYSGSGYATGAPCFGPGTPTYTNPYSAISFDHLGNAQWNVSALSTTSGNLNGGGNDFDVRNATTIEVGSGGSLPAGLYTTSSVNGNSMTLTQTVKGGSATCPTTVVSTITLTR